MRARFANIIIAGALIFVQCRIYMQIYNIIDNFAEKR